MIFTKNFIMTLRTDSTASCPEPPMLRASSYRCRLTFKIGALRHLSLLWTAPFPVLLSLAVIRIHGHATFLTDVTAFTHLVLNRIRARVCHEPDPSALPNVKAQVVSQQQSKRPTVLGFGVQGLGSSMLANSIRWMHRCIYVSFNVHLMTRST